VHDRHTLAMTIVPAPTHPLRDAARAILPEVIDLRRRLHRVPEVGLQLPLTQAIVVDALRGIGLEPRLGRSVSSVVAVIEGSGPGPTILLRADTDGLPLVEETGLPFVSDHQGRMHACAHDTHTAMLVGAARLLAERRATFPGRVLLVFQPGEEAVGGARHMLEEGLLDAAGDERPSGAFALHTMAMYPAGTINIRPGVMLAAGDTLRITIEGRGGHASMPHRAVDPVTVAAEMILAFQTMVGRRVDVFDPAVVTIAHVTAGTTTNIIAETASLGGTMRTVSDATRVAVRAEIRRVAEGIAAAHGARVEVGIEPGYPPTVNDPAFTDLVVGEARGLLDDEDVRLMPAPIMGAEDFSYILAEVPGAMAFLGSRPSDLDPLTAPSNHSNRVVFDEPAMAVGVALHVAVALRHLGVP
jgi:amidohydrolase